MCLSAVCCDPLPRPLRAGYSPPKHSKSRPRRRWWEWSGRARLALTAVLYLPSRPEAASSIYHTSLAQDVISLTGRTWVIRTFDDRAWLVNFYGLFIAVGRVGLYTSLPRLLVEGVPPLANMLLLLDPCLLELGSIEVNDHLKLITATARTTATEATCPLCQQRSQQVHSHYSRTLADLPCCGQRVRWIIQVRRFRCLNANCKRKLFTERVRRCALIPLVGGVQHH